MKKKYEIYIKDKDVEHKIKKAILKSIHSIKKDYEKIAIICIGTVYSAGDSLGPFVGHLMNEKISDCSNCTIYGTLENPVHAENLVAVLKTIDQSNTLIIAVDASLGKEEEVGYIHVNNSPLLPGIGIGNKLPPVGDISIMGIVNVQTKMSSVTIQNSSMYLVYTMAKLIAEILVEIFI